MKRRHYLSNILFISLLSLSNVQADEMNFPRLPIIHSIMEEQYGDHYDQDNDCWHYHHEMIIEDNIDPNNNRTKRVHYCLTPDNIILKQIDNSDYLYFTARGATDDSVSGRYTAGLVGLFALKSKSTSNNWEYIIASKANTMGMSNGHPPHLKFYIINQKGAPLWISLEGNVWQGVTVSNYYLHGVKDGKYHSFGSLPMITEADQEHKYTIEFEAVKGNEYYPLIYKKIINDQLPMTKSEKREPIIIDQERIIFDIEQFQYQSQKFFP